MDPTIGKATQFTPGRSGNPGGKSKKQAQFEAALADALVFADPVARAQELAEIAWKAARDGQSWAVSLLFQRLAPQTFSVRMENGSDIQHVQRIFLEALCVLPDHQRYAVSRRLLDLDRALTAEENGDVQ